MLVGPTPQQAALGKQGVLREAPGRGLIVAPLDLDYVRSMYDIRAVMEGLAFHKAAERNAERARKQGPALIQSGRRAVKSGSVAGMITADLRVHDFIYELSENALIKPAMEAQWTYTQRVMGEVLIRDEQPRHIWDQHEALLTAVMAGDGLKAEQLARQHVVQAADVMIARLAGESLREADAASAIAS